MSAPIKLSVKTDPAWVKIILDNFDAFLADHADCERKASAMAMGFVAKYPDRTSILRPMIDLALEELTHFRQVFDILTRRGIKLPEKMAPDPYVNALLAHKRNDPDGGFLDKLLITGIVESRGAERFRLVAQGLKDAKLKRFYRSLCRAEAKHGGLFSDLARHFFDKKTIQGRTAFLVGCEADIIRRLPWRPSLH